MRTSRGPTARRSIVVRTSGSVAETAAMALAVEMTASRLAEVGGSSKPQPYGRRESLPEQVLRGHPSVLLARCRWGRCDAVAPGGLAGPGRCDRSGAGRPPPAAPPSPATTDPGRSRAGP